MSGMLITLILSAVIESLWRFSTAPGDVCIHSVGVGGLFSPKNEEATGRGNLPNLDLASGVRC